MNKHHSYKESRCLYRQSLTNSDTVPTSLHKGMSNIGFWNPHWMELRCWLPLLDWMIAGPTIISFHSVQWLWEVMILERKDKTKGDACACEGYFPGTLLSPHPLLYFIEFWNFSSFVEVGTVEAPHFLKLLPSSLSIRFCFSIF